MSQFQKIMTGALLLALTACQNKVQDQNSIASANGSADGIVNGQAAPQNMSAVMQIYSEDAMCSAALVGLNPPTLITARHCIESGVYELNGLAPDQIILSDFPGATYDMNSGELPGDIAILIYPKNVASTLSVKESDLFTVAPVKLTWGEPMSFCGYGVTGPGVDDQTLPKGDMCGQALLMTPNMDFINSFINSDFTKQLMASKAPATGFLKFTEQQKVEYIQLLMQSSILEFGPNTRFGIGRLTADAFQMNPTKGYDATPKFSLVNHGDSGGPWFVRVNGDTNPHLFAISSAVSDAEPDTKDIQGAFAWSLYDSWSEDLMGRAVAAGGDIKGYVKGLYPVPKDAPLPTPTPAPKAPAPAPKPAPPAPKK